MYRQSPIIKWRRYGERYRLEGNRCKSCSIVFFPKKHVCSCGSREFELHKFSGKGKIITYTQIKAAPEIFNEMAPYCVAIIELEEGPRITGQIADTDASEISIGDKVDVVFRKLNTIGKEGIINYGFKFKLTKKEEQTKLES